MRSAPWFIAIAFVLLAGSAVARAAEPGASGAGETADGTDVTSRDAPDADSPLIVTGDFNQDGVPDIARVVTSGCGSFEARSLTVSLGQKEGGFRQVASISVADRDPRAIALGDFNGDGSLDLIVGDGDGSLTEFLGDGKGQFVPAGEIAHFGSVVSIAMGDFNRDGHLDLAVSDPRTGSVAVLLGEGNGSLQQAWSFSLPVKGVDFHVAAADFDGDGTVDLAVTNDDDSSYEVMLGNGNGAFTYSPALSNVKDPNSHCAA